MLNHVPNQTQSSQTQQRTDKVADILMHSFKAMVTPNDTSTLTPLEKQETTH